MAFFPNASSTASGSRTLAMEKLMKDFNAVSGLMVPVEGGGDKLRVPSESEMKGEKLRVPSESEVKELVHKLNWFRLDLNFMMSYDKSPIIIRNPAQLHFLARFVPEGFAVTTHADLLVSEVDVLADLARGYGFKMVSSTTTA